MRYTWVCTADASVLTKSATSSPCTALTWLAKPSSAWSGCTWLQIQLRVPVFVFSAISHGAVGTMTPLGSVVASIAGRLGSLWRWRACACGFLRVAPATLEPAARRARGTQRGELEELAAVNRSP